MGIMIEKIRGIFNKDKNKNIHVMLEEKKYPTVTFNIDENNEEYFLEKMKQIKFGNNHDCCLPDILEQLLLKIGLNIDDVVKINDINYVRNIDDQHDYIVNFSINDVNLYKFIFRYDDMWDIHPTLIFVKDNESFGYNMHIDVIDKKLMNLRDSFYEIETDYGIYRRDYSYGMANYMVRWGYYSLNLEVYEHKDYRYDIMNSYKYKLDNEDKLRDYLMSLKFPVRIDEVYKKIQRDFLGDISKYPTIKLECMTFDHCNGIDVVSDKILITDGEWKNFGMTRGNKTIMLEHTGEWSYRLLDSNMDVKLSMNIEEDDVSYKIHGQSKEELDKYFNEYVKKDIEDANIEVDKTKKLVRSIFEREDIYNDR